MNSENPAVIEFLGLTLKKDFSEATVWRYDGPKYGIHITVQKERSCGEVYCVLWQTPLTVKEAREEGSMGIHVQASGSTLQEALDLLAKRLGRIVSALESLKLNEEIKS